MKPILKKDTTFSFILLAVSFLNLELVWFLCVDAQESVYIIYLVFQTRKGPPLKFDVLTVSPTTSQGKINK